MRWELGEREAGLLWLQEANDIAMRLAAENPSVPSLQGWHYRDSRQLSAYFRELGKVDEAARLMRQARAALERLERLPSRTAADLFNLACVRASCAAPPAVGQTASGFEDDRRERLHMADLAIAALVQAVDLGFRDVESLRRDTDLAAIRDRDDFKKLAARAELAARATSAEELARSDGASPAQKLERNREALAIRERLAGADPKDRRLRGDVAASHHAIGVIQVSLNRLDEARASFERALALRQGLARSASRNDRSRIDLGSTMIALGSVEWESGRLAEGDRLWREGEELWSRAESEAPVSRRDPGRLAAMRQSIGYCLRRSRALGPGRAPVCSGLRGRSLRQLRSVPPGRDAASRRRR